MNLLERIKDSLAGLLNGSLQPESDSGVSRIDHSPSGPNQPSHEIQADNDIYSVVGYEAARFCDSKLKLVPGSAFNLREVAILVPEAYVDVQRHLSNPVFAGNLLRTVKGQIRSHGDTTGSLRFDDSMKVVAQLRGASPSEEDSYEIWSSGDAEVTEKGQRFVVAVRFTGSYIGGSSVEAQSAPEAAPVVSLQLWQEGTERKTINAFPCTLGREGSFVVAVDDLSRLHASLRLVGESVCIQHNSNEGTTLLNGVELKSGIDRPLATLDGTGKITLVGTRGSNVTVHYSLGNAATGASVAPRLVGSIPTPMLKFPASSGPHDAPIAPQVEQPNAGITPIPEAQMRGGEGATSVVWRLEAQPNGMSGAIEHLDFNADGFAVLPGGPRLKRLVPAQKAADLAAVIEVEHGQLCVEDGAPAPSVIRWLSGVSYFYRDDRGVTHRVTLA